MGTHSLHKRWPYRSFTFSVAAVLAMECLLARPTPAAPDSRAVDYVHPADLIVNRSWKLAPGEHVVMFWDETRDPGIGAPLRAAIQKAW